jgi:mannose-6-phosphate isomerase-like protein (cupin superfamily)
VSSHHGTCHDPGIADRIVADMDVEGEGTLWSLASADLNATLLSWPPGGGVATHRNTERDVLLLVVGGEGVVRVDGEDVAVGTHTALLIPQGAERSISAGSAGLRYLSVHLRRDGLTQIRRP